MADTINDTVTPAAGASSSSEAVTLESLNTLLQQQATQLSTLTANHATLAAENAALKQSLSATQDDSDDLQDKFAKQSQQLAKVTADQQTLATENAALKIQLAANTGVAVAPAKKALPVIPVSPVSYGGKSYKFTAARFTIPAIIKDNTGKVVGYGSPKTVTAEEAVADPSQEIIKEILAIPGQGILKEVL